MQNPENQTPNPLEYEAGATPVLNVYRVVAQIVILAIVLVGSKVVLDFLLRRVGGEGAGVAIVCTHATVLLMSVINALICIPTRFGNPFTQGGITSWMTWLSWAAIGVYFLLSLMLLLRNS
jgi:hypothetical protein